MRRFLLACASLMAGHGLQAQPPPGSPGNPISLSAPDAARVQAVTCAGPADATVRLQAALAAAAVAPGPGVVEISYGLCPISAPIVQVISAGHSITLRGPGGAGGISSADGSGIAIILGDPTAQFDVSGMTFFHQGPGQSGTGLSVTATHTQAQPSHFDNLGFTGPAAASAWQVGLHLTGLAAPVLRGIRTLLPNGDGAGRGYGVRITGVDTGHFAIDAKISDGVFQGGRAGILAEGAVQGVFVTNSEAIGNDYGIYATDPGGTGLAELVTVSNSHFNNVVGGIHLDHVNQDQIVGNLFLHFNPQPGGVYHAIWADHSAYVNVVGNTVNGAAVGAETFVRVNDAAFVTVTSNNVVTLSGPCVDAATRVSAVVVTGNSCQGVSTPALLLPAESAASTGNLVNGLSAAVTDGFLPRAGGVADIGAGGFPYNNVFAQTLALMPAPDAAVSTLKADGAGGLVASGTLATPGGLQLGRIPVTTSPGPPTQPPPGHQPGALNIAADGHLWIYQHESWVLIR